MVLTMMTHPLTKALQKTKAWNNPSIITNLLLHPSGMQFYTSDVIPAWKGNLFIGSMVLTHLNRLVIKDNKVVKEERLLSDKKWRVRSVKQGPDGYLYLGVDGGRILRIMPD